MSRRVRYSPEVKERAVRLVFEQRQHHESEWAAIESVASKIGCTAETPRKWVRQPERVEPICRVLPIAPSTYYEHKARERNPSRLPARAKRDEELRGEILRVRRENFDVYGVRKVWRQLGREGKAVARCTVARLMREMGLQGAVRGRRFKTTKPGPSGARPMDLVERNFNATRPNELWVSDLTYVVTWRDFVRADVSIRYTERLADVEFAMLERVHWFNTQRLLEPIGNIPPIEHELNYYREQEGSHEMARLN